MKRRHSEALAAAGIVLGAGLLSAFVFVAFFAPSWPRTPWGWLISAALGIPLLVLGEMIIALVFHAGPRPWNLVRRGSWPGSPVFRYPAGSRTARTLMLVARIVIAAALCGAILWLFYAIFLGHGIIRAQFR